MDKETLSNYGWIVICVMVLAVMIALATPFGSYIKDAVSNTTEGLFGVNQNALDAAGITIDSNTLGIKMLEGNNQEYTKTESEALSFRSSAEIDDFVSVAVDGNTVAPKNYTVTEGSTIITLLQEYLNQLPVGTHTITIESTTGTVTATFVVHESTKNPALNPNGIIPTGATYTKADGTVLKAGDTMPEIATGDRYRYGDYEYRYNQTYGGNWKTDESQNGWAVDTILNTKTSYGEILESINGKPITNMNYTFEKCSSLISSPKIPSTVTKMNCTFRDCTSLIDAPAIPSKVTDMTCAFYNCQAMVVAPDMSNAVSVTTMTYTFRYCYALEVAPIFADNAPIEMYETFSSCSSLKTYIGSADPDGDFSNYKLPSNLKRIDAAFIKCTSMIIGPDFSHCTQLTSAFSVFSGCASLTQVHTFPVNVVNMTDAFNNCTSFAGEIRVPCTAQYLMTVGHSGKYVKYHYDGCGH